MSPWRWSGRISSGSPCTPSADSLKNATSSAVFGPNASVFDDAPHKQPPLMQTLQIVHQAAVIPGSEHEEQRAHLSAIDERSSIGQIDEPANWRRPRTYDSGRRPTLSGRHISVD